MRMAVPAHLTIKIDNLAVDSLLADWRWLVQPAFMPVLMTAFGDLFLRDEAGHIHFLDLMSGEFKQVAESEEEFARLCEDREQRRNWFIAFLLMELRKLRGDLAAGECYSCNIPLSLGGKLNVDNFDRTDLQIHYSVLGQLHRQTKHLPPGTRIDSIKIESLREDTEPKSFWQMVRNWARLTRRA
jgi:hypothetical protein